jgi:hypothetical protein
MDEGMMASMDCRLAICDWRLKEKRQSFFGFKSSINNQQSSIIK